MCVKTQSLIVLLASLSFSQPLVGQQRLAGAVQGSSLESATDVLDRPAGLKIDGARLSEALTQLAYITGVGFAFSPSLLPADKLVTCDCELTTIRETLDRLLDGTGLRYTVLGNQVVVERGPQQRELEVPAAPLKRRGSPDAVRIVPLVRRPLPQEGAVQGTVTSADDGEPLNGVVINVLGTDLAGLTDAQGSYAIGNVPAGEVTLTARLIGYGQAEQVVRVVADETVTADFTLEQEAILLEGLVVVGYGTQRRQDVTGSVASVSPARMEDVPNTSVAQALQAAAPGINVSPAATGAEPRYDILIRGQNSITASNNPLVVVDGIPYNGNLAEINQSDVASIDILKDASAGAVYGARGANGVILITTKKGRAGEARFSYEGYAGIQRIANVPRVMTGSEFAEFKCERLSEYMPCEEALTPTEREALAAGHYTDWLDLATRLGVQQQHTLSVSGGTEDTRFYVSASALDTKGIALNDQFERYTLRVNLDQKVGSWADFGVSAQMSQADRGGMPASFSSAYFANPLIPAYEDDGHTLALTPWPEDPNVSNPLSNLRVTNDDLSRRAVGGAYTEVRLPFVEGLSFRVNGGVDILSRDAGTYYGRDTPLGRSQEGSAITESQRRFDWTIENILRYTREAGAHSLDLTGLYSAQGSNLEENALLSQGFPNDVLTYRQAHVARSIEPSYVVRESGLISQVARLNYGYDDRYLVTLTVRRDGSSGFGANYKYGTFPSIGLGWNVSNESFWRSEILHDLKLRLSYGQNGNQAIQPYQTLAQLAENSYLTGESTRPGFVPSTLGNENLRWETTTSLNAGLDFGLLANRLQGSLDLYFSETHDLLLDRLVSPVHGIPRMVENIGRVRNRGIELALSGVPLKNSRFSWATDFNVSANRNRILDLYGDETDDLVNQWFIGRSINTNFGYAFDGVWQEGDDIANSAQPSARPGDARVKDLNGDGRIDADDRTFHGDRDPSYTAALSNTLRLGNLSLNVFVQAVVGVTRLNEGILADVTVGHVRFNALRLDYWSPENPINTRWANRDHANTFDVGAFEDASFIRLKDLTLSYDLPDAFVRQVGAAGLRLYANGRNLWTNTSWTGLDPELANQGLVPLERLFSVGVRASF